MIYPSNVASVSNGYGKVAAVEASMNGQGRVVGGATIITDTHLKPNKVAISNGAGKVTYYITSI